MKSNNRIISIDILRVLCCFFVVIIHSADMYNIGIIRWFSRFAVPLFFIISGYFFEQCNNSKKEMQIKKMFKLSIYAHGFYLVEQICKQIIMKENINVHQYFSLKEIFLYNYFPFAEQMWFLIALSISLFIIYIFIYKKKIMSNKSILLTSTILIILNLLLGTYSKIFFGINIEPEITRNFLFLGIPFCLLGVVINRKKKELEKVKNIYLYISIVLSIIISYIELKIIALYGANSFENCVGQVLLSILLFVYALNNKGNNNIKILNILSSIGSEYSLYIYIFHPIINNFISLIINKIDIIFLNNIYKMTCPIIVFIISLTASYVYINLKKIILERIKKND